MNQIKAITIILLLFTLLGVSHAKTMTGKVVKIVDGDTVHILIKDN